MSSWQAPGTPRAGVSSPESSPQLLRNAADRRQAEFHVFAGGGPGGDADAHRRPAVPFRASAPAGAVLLYLGNDGACYRRLAERDQHLVDRHFVQDLMSRRAQPLGESPCMAAR